MMENNKLIKGLKGIHDRYFRFTLNGTDVNHHADCAIYRSLKMYNFCFCSCGLLHDLETKIDELIGVIYPRYWDDYYLQEFQTSAIKRDQDIQEAEKVLVKVFGLLGIEKIEDVKQDYNRYKKAIIAVFGEHELYIQRLDQWLKGRLEKIERLKLLCAE